MIFPRAFVPVAVLLLSLPLRAQDLVLPAQNWRTITTEHFLIHYPVQMEEWTKHAASRIEDVNASVGRLVGFSPQEKITVLVDDPLNVSNGYMMPGPLICLFPTPPEPRSSIGEHRGWGEILSGHELAHVAHLSRPSRNSFDNFLRSILPVKLGPIVQGPRWMMEGYATYIEGKLTGAGRPHGLWRPTILRQWAIEGSLPHYSQLSATEGFYAGSMAYLAGSAFLEWLAEKEGDESLVSVWRRMTARTPRSFSSAFYGVYGASPDELYGRFTAELTAAAIATERSVQTAGTAEGDLFLRFGWYTSDPTLSPDGKQLAIVQRSRYSPSRLIVFQTEEDTLSDAARRAAERARTRDPEDVPAINRGPRLHKQLAILESPAERPYDSPSFMDGGDRILLTRLEGLGDGSYRPDLFEWRWRQNSLRRITHGAAIRHPDAAPSGDWAAATQCLSGFCSIVRVALRDGAVSVLAQGTAERTFYRARVAPDGRSIVASMQEGGRWRLILIDVTSGAISNVGPDDNASRFDADFTRDGKIVTVSSAGGIFNLEMVDPATRTARRITNLASSAFAPTITPQGDTAYFLSLRANGYQVRRIATSTIAATPVMGDAMLAIANAIAPVAAPQPRSVALGASDSYGLGPQRLFWMPYAGGTGSSWYGGGILSLGDPVGTISSTLVATAGSASAWRGAAARTVLRALPIEVGLDLQVSRKFLVIEQNTAVRTNLNYQGVQLFARKNFDYADRFLSLSLGGWTGRREDTNREFQSRSLGFASLNASFVQQNGPLRFHKALRANFEAGKTDGASWNRFVAAFDATIESPGPDLSAAVRYGTGSVANAPSEQFMIGGDLSPHLDTRSSGNLIAAPLLRNALLSGAEFLQARAELSGFFPFNIYGDWTWPGGDDSDYFATGGIFISTNAPRLPQLASPALTGQLGVGTVLAGSQPRRATFFLTVRVTP